jgi:hypothetical protein
VGITQFLQRIASITVVFYNPEKMIKQLDLGAVKKYPPKGIVQEIKGYIFMLNK